MSNHRIVCWVVELGFLATSARPGIAQCQQAKLTASDAARGDRFGVSVSVDGDYALVDRFGSDSVFHRVGSQWVEEAKPDGFGSGGVIQANRIVFGNAADDGAGIGAGAVNVLRREGLNWVLEQKLTASDAAAGDWFGVSVDIDGDVIVVGATGNDDAALDGGAVYVFRWNGMSWMEEQKLIASDALASDRMGLSVSVSGTVIIVSAPRTDPVLSPGKAYIFRRNATTWIQEQKLTVPAIAPYEIFANDVAISGDFAVVGVPAQWGDEDPPRPGSVYVFGYDGSAWLEEAKLQASDFGCCGDLFGSSVALRDKVLVVGAPEGPDRGIPAFTGSAYLFQRVGTTWMEQAKLTRSDAEAGDFFGASVDVAAQYALVGAFLDDDVCPADRFCESGSAYIFSLGQCGAIPIPAVSIWGMVVLGLLILTGGTIVIKNSERPRFTSICEGSIAPGS